jgi:hypothetical protein
MMMHYKDQRILMYFLHIIQVPRDNLRKSRIQLQPLNFVLSPLANNISQYASFITIAEMMMHYKDQRILM